VELTHLKTTVYISLIFILFCLVGCENNEESMLLHEEPTAQTILKVNGQVFCVPSPIEAALFLREDGENYNPTALLQYNEAHLTNSKEDKALLLGAFGADLAYSAAFEDNEHTLKTLAVMRSLCEDLELTTALGASEIDQLESSLKQRDSLTIKIGELFFRIDNYLKSNQSEKLSGLILTGGWIESMYFCAQKYHSGKTKALVSRMVEQRAAVEGLLNVSQTNGVLRINKRLEGLIRLYRDIPIQYIYTQPITDSLNGITELLGEEKVVAEDSKIKALADTLIHVRQQLLHHLK